VESVYSAVRTECLYKTDTLVFKGLKDTENKICDLEKEAGKYGLIIHPNKTNVTVLSNKKKGNLTLNGRITDEFETSFALDL
jgi:hypothetical protein